MEALLLAAALASAPKLAAAERAFVAFRDADDLQRRTPSPAHERARARAVRSVEEALRTVAPGADDRAVDAMRHAIGPDDSAPDAEAKRVYEAFGKAASSIRFDGETLDRLTVLSRLGSEPDPERRRRLFLALAPMWETISGPYPSLVASRRETFTAEVTKKAQAWGMSVGALEALLTTILNAWRDQLPSAKPVEPWDWFHENTAASRALAPRLPRDVAIETALRYYRDLGADPEALHVRLDLLPRPGKDPVAFTDFLRHGRLSGDTFQHGRFLISTSYAEGGLGNVYELMHEMGHAAHIAAIRTRPAFNDWPDDDVFTEALADMLGTEAYEPGFVRRYIGVDVDRRALVREALAATMMDVAWALFEIRVQASSVHPSVIWTTITTEYLGIAPHPELPWWAMRGQLIDAPGYMTNYALGAVITSALRARVRELYGARAFEDPSPALYARLSERLYRFGLERPSRAVVEEFLGGPQGTRALTSAIAEASAR
ncbi:MAG TPA: hypothetical protein VFV19_05755 [Candidatus Polarisedimenticolaceae bacterium]|nr:hypothetical protein [Candidatus Polarisedimenticolaceae bacterium]